MRPINGSWGLPFSARRALVALIDEFEQRKIGKTAQSFREQIPLDGPSGAQWVESNLESKAVKQIAFVPNFYDLMTQPIIRYELAGKKRVYTPDIACVFQSVDGALPGRFLIEVKPRNVLRKHRGRFEDGFHAARELCKNMGAAFRVLHEGHLNTAYLRNTNLLSRYLRQDPDFRANDLLEGKFGDRKFTKREGDVALAELYPEPWMRAEASRVLIAWRVVSCDLMQDVTDETYLWIPRNFDPGPPDPFLTMLNGANDDY